MVSRIFPIATVLMIGNSNIETKYVGSPSPVRFDIDICKIL